MVEKIDSLIKSYYDSLNGKYLQIADFLLNNQFDENLSIQRLAKDCDVSPATISRFVKILNLKNFQSLKLALLNRKINFPIYHGIDKDDSYLEIAQKTFSANIAALNSTIALLDEKSLEQAVSCIINSNVVALFGLGASEIVAQNGYHKLLRTATNVTHATDYHMQLMQATRLQERDCAIIISHSGENKDILEIAKVLHDNSVPMIVITSFGNSAITKYATFTLLSISEEKNFRVDALHALIAQMSIIDSLFMMIAVRSGKKTDEVYQSIRAEINKTRNKKEAE
ncbi:transcriptional regulator [Companilactobacillus sp. RD055328]|uniref:MurR/RpiR family transcriptional regulator n=1 Tax=Companilactobacillus sp. RD055328 TaxID=2916634 RepID=UPI001FC7F3D5|nr:MurR/RpiR family transcriptional regulator [Companilactobacillus sp. RD055328]GKQ43395.1 transcriptional regulator [Companilactobacillus sp. RD055328]